MPPTDDNISYVTESDSNSEPNSKHWFTTSFLQPLPYFIYVIGSRKLSANEQFFLLVLKQ